MTTRSTSSLLDEDMLDDVRASLAQVMADPDADVDAALSDMGWDDVVALDPVAASALLFAAQGRALRQSNALGALMLAELGDVLPRTDGVRVLAIPYDGGAVLSHEPAPGTQVVIPMVTEHGRRLVIGDATQTTAHAGFDLYGRWFDVGQPASGTEYDPAEAWEIAVARGRVALAEEILGCCETALASAVEHASTRTQYGREIGRFQGVRHRLGESFAALEAARGVVAAARLAGTPEAAALAKFQTGRVQKLVLRHTMHVLGAMGITLEGSMHRHVTRAAVLDLLLGSHLELADEIGSNVLASDELDPLIEV